MAEPISVADAKTHLRVTHDEHDDLIADQIREARDLIEQDTWRALTQRTFRATLRRFPTDDQPIFLPRPPLVSVQSITYLDLTGTARTLATSRYVVATTREPGYIEPSYGWSWPATRDAPNAVVIDYVAGFADNACPPGLVSAIKLRLSQIYDDRIDPQREQAIERFVRKYWIRDARLVATLEDL